MAVFEIEGPNGKIYEVEAPDARTAARVAAQFADPAGGVAVDSAAAQDLGGRMSAMARGAANGATFGLRDEFLGPFAAMGGVFTGDVKGPDQFDAEAQAVTEGIRARDAAAREAFPGSYGAGNVGGGVAAGLASGVAAAGRLAGAGIGGAMKIMGGVGGAEGALTAAGNADGQNVGMQALGGGLLGAGLGAAAVPVAAGVRGAVNAVTGLMGRGNDKRAAIAIAKAMQRAGMGPDDVARVVAAARREGQPFVGADALGSAGQRMLAGVARSPGEARAEIEEFLLKRQAGQADRLSDFVMEALAAPDTAAARVDALKRLRSQTGAINYGKARETAGPVDVRGVVQTIDSEIMTPRGMVADDGIDKMLAKYRNRLQVPDDKLPKGAEAMYLSDFERVRRVKEDLGDELTKLTGNARRIMSKVYGALDDVLSAASDGYRKANDVFAAQSRVIDAVDAGKQAARPGRTQDALDAYRRAKGSGNLPAATGARPFDTEQAAFRVGYADPLLAKIENAAPGVNKARPLSSPKNEAMMAEMAADPALWKRRLARENTMFATQNAALGGSRTADNLADAADVSGGQLMEAVMAPRAAITSSIVRKVGEIAAGQNEKTRALIAKALLSDDPKAALEPLLRKAILAQYGQRTGEAFMRQLGYSAAGLKG